MSELSESLARIILEHISVCEDRFGQIASAEDFVNSENGQLMLDAISMRLQAIGENVKRLLKTDPLLAEKNPLVDWESIVRFRDFISHHYEMLDYEVIFDIGKNQLLHLKNAIRSEIKNKS